MSVSIFFSFPLYILAYSHQLSVLFFQLQSTFLFYAIIFRQKGQFNKVLGVVLLFSPDRIIHATVPWTHDFFWCCCCYMSVVLTRHLFKNPNVLHFVKVLFISNFTIVKEENDSSLQQRSSVQDLNLLVCKNKVLSNSKTNFY